MNEVGRIIHIAMSGRLIVKLDKEINPGQIVFDEKGNNVGKIIELIGPVNSPYASIEINNKNPEYNKKQYFKGLTVYYKNSLSFKKNDPRKRKSRGVKKRND